MGKNILTALQQQVLDVAAENGFVTKQFYFTGGTVLSQFYLQHRVSEDLDFFSENEYNQVTLVKEIAEIAKKAGITKIEQQNLRGQDVFYLFLTPGEMLKIDFAYFPFEHSGKFGKYKALRYSSLEDIVTNKVQALLSRKRSRDYLDLYLGMEKLGWKAADLQKKYRLKFDVELHHDQLATAFANVSDSQDLPRFLGEYNWKDVEDYFLGLARSLGKDLLEN